VANEDKATHYHRLQRRAALVASLLGVLFLALVTITGTAASLGVSLEAALGSRGLAAASFAGMLLLAYELLALPLAYYRGVTLERRYGLSSETRTHWWLTHAKTLLVGGVLTVTAAVVLAALLAWSPVRWWLLASALFAALIVALAWAAPVWLFPIFYEFRPLDRPALTARLVELARRAGTPISGVFEWRLGDRTRKANAALVGIGDTRRILLSDTLLETHSDDEIILSDTLLAEYSDDEIEVILAHELAHQVYGDLWTGLAVQTVIVTAGLYAAHRVLLVLRGSFGIAEMPTAVEQLPTLALVAGAVMFVLSPVAHALSRAHERRADRFAIERTGNAAAFMSAIKRLSSQNLAEVSPPAWVEALLHSHPSTTRRLESARRWAAGR
jgi:STE24 endopeptidase